MAAIPPDHGYNQTTVEIQCTQSQYDDYSDRLTTAVAGYGYTVKFKVVESDVTYTEAVPTFNKEMQLPVEFISSHSAKNSVVFKYGRVGVREASKVFPSNEYFCKRIFRHVSSPSRRQVYNQKRRMYLQG